MAESAQSEARSERLGLYLSVPFCRHKCSFCNFASGVGTGESLTAYVETLCGEIAAAGAIAAAAGGELPRIVDSVYLGGGTPSLLSGEQLRRVFAAMRGEFEVDADAEITLEAAPGQIADELLDMVLRLGVNRVSLGVQSFVDRECAAVGRAHTGGGCLKELARLRAAGVASVGADLIAGLPYQTEASWRVSLTRAVEASACGNLQHLSVYMLEVDEDSRLGREVLLGGQRFHAGHVVSEELTAVMYEAACEELPAAGFAQYEISNFSRAGFASRHNRKYWQREPYLGLGLDAHSMLWTSDGGAVRFANPDTLGAYAGAASARDVTRVGVREAFEETVFLGLRLCEGLAAERLRGFPAEWVKEFAEAAQVMVRSGTMWRKCEVWGLTLRGQLVSSEVFGELLAGVPA